MAEGHYTLPTRVYLTPAQRAKLERLLDSLERQLDEWLTELVAAQLDPLPDPPPDPPATAGPPSAEELRRRRAELRRLRPKLSDPHNPPLAWLVQMVADLEAEVRRLEGKDEG